MHYIIIFSGTLFAIYKISTNNSYYKANKMIKSLNKILNGLSAQYADEYLSSSEKDRILNDRPVENKPQIYADQSRIINPAQFIDHKKHIALLCNDTTNQNVLSYILANSNNYSVDVLFHGMHKNTVSESFYKLARSSFYENGIDIRLVKLINDSVSDIKNYLMKHRTLQYLVTDSHDLLITDFLNNHKIQKDINVPIVLIN